MGKAERSPDAFPTCCMHAPGPPVPGRRGARQLTCHVNPKGFYCMYISIYYIYSVHVTLMAAHLQLLQWHGTLLRTIFAEEEAGRLRTQAQAML